MRRQTTSGKPVDIVVINMHEPVALKLSLRYLISFTKATPLSPVVRASLQLGGANLGKAES